MSEVLGNAPRFLPDPSTFLEVEPAEIAGYREQGRATGLDLPAQGRYTPEFNNFFLFWSGLTVKELIEKGVLVEDERLNNTFCYEVYYRRSLRDGGERGEKLLAAFSRFATDYPLADRYLREAAILTLLSRGISTGSFSPQLRPQAEEIQEKIIRMQMTLQIALERGDRTYDYQARFDQAVWPVIAFSLDKISEYSGIPWDELAK